MEVLAIMCCLTTFVCSLTICVCSLTAFVEWCVSLFASSLGAY